MIATLLEDISNVLKSVELQTSERGAIEHDTLVGNSRCYGNITDDNHLFDKIFYSIQSVNHAFLPLFLDMSLQISRDHIMQMVNSGISDYLEIDYNDYKAKLTRISNPTCEFKGNAIRAQSKWRLENTVTGDLKEFNIRFHLKQYPDGLKIITVATRTMAFYDDDMKEIDPFKSLPITDRFQLNTEVNLRFRKTIENMPLSIPNNELNGQDLSFIPAEFLFEDSIYVYSRGKKRGRVRYPLFLRQPSLGYNFVMSVRKEHIIPILAAIVRAKNADLISADFYNGRIGIGSYGSQSRSILHISVEGQVWMNHNITLTASFGQLNYRASWSSWRYNIHASLCWPFCGKVIDEATDTVMEIIESKKYFNGSIASSIPGSFRCRISPEALIFYFN